MHHLLRRHRGMQLAKLRLTPTWIGIVFGLSALAVGSAVCAARIGAKRRHEKKNEDEQRVATWEGEGGAPQEPAGAH